jgi:hypothetical protein
MVGGKGPEKLFLDRSKKSRKDMLHIHPGILGERLLLLTSKSCKELQLDMLSGIAPCKLLFESMRKLNKHKLVVRCLGILPVKTLLDKSKSLSKLMLLNEDGMLPLKPL